MPMSASSGLMESVKPGAHRNALSYLPCAARMKVQTIAHQTAQLGESSTGSLSLALAAMHAGSHRSWAQARPERELIDQHSHLPGQTC